jgi:hypothetical protein
MLRSRLESLGLRIGSVALCAVGATLMAPALFGAACTVGTLASYQTGANDGCTIDGYTVDFGNGILSGSDGFTATGVNQLTPSEITVTPTIAGNSFTLEFSGATNFLFAGQPDGGNTYQFDYTLDPVLPRITGVDINEGPGDPPTLTGEFCGNGLIVSASTCSSGADYLSLTLTSNGTSTGYPAADGTFPTPVTNMETELTLVLDPCESIQYFGSTVNLVPEPSMLWLTPGLVGLLWARKKWLTKGR